MEVELNDYNGEGRDYKVWVGRLELCKAEPSVGIMDDYYEVDYEITRMAEEYDNGTLGEFFDCMLPEDVDMDDFERILAVKYKEQCNDD